MDSQKRIPPKVRSASRYGSIQAKDSTRDWNLPYPKRRKTTEEAATDAEEMETEEVAGMTEEVAGMTDAANATRSPRQSTSVSVRLRPRSKNL